ncbi:hypothetical protein [Bacillus yapensis]|nr:hypothetical protein [Bacillus yapensis]
MQPQRDGFFQLMCKNLGADEVSHLTYNESRLAKYLEHASVDAICFNSIEKRSYAFECKYVSEKSTPNVTFELSHQNGKVGWALDECTMNNYIVYFLQGVGAVLCDMKAFQDAVKRNIDAFDTREYNGSNITQVHYDWLISEACGTFYTEEQLLQAEAFFRSMQGRRLVAPISEIGALTYKYNMQGIVHMSCAKQVQ